jgi:DNA-binding Lrp family transcriptional regulator
MDRSEVRERARRALELLSRHGCLTSGALAQMLGISNTQAEYALKRLWREGIAKRYALGMIDAWCLGPPSAIGTIGILCDGRVIYISARRLAHTALELLQSSKVLKLVTFTRRLSEAPCAAFLSAAHSILRLMLDGCAVEDRRSGRYMFMVTSPACAAERLQRLAETGALPLDPIPPP